MILAHRQLDHGKDACELGFAVNDRPFATSPAVVERKDAMLYHSVRLQGEQLLSFDRIKRLTLTLCDER